MIITRINCGLNSEIKSESNVDLPKRSFEEFNQNKYIKTVSFKEFHRKLAF